MAIILRSEKGAPLLAAEIDGNFSFLLEQITELQAGVVAEGIASVSIDGDGNHIYRHSWHDLGTDCDCDCASCEGRMGNRHGVFAE